MKSLPNILTWNPRDLEAARFRIGIKILGFFSNKSELEATKMGGGEGEKAKSSRRLEIDDFAIGNNTIMKLTDLENVLDSLKTLKDDSSSKYE